MTAPPGTDPAGAELLALIHCDLGSVVRARSLPMEDLEREAHLSAGWVPSAQARPPLGPSAKSNPFGSRGDMRLLADRDTLAIVGAEEGSSALGLVICDLVETTGKPWDCCPRAFLRETLGELEQELGCTAWGSFEHEFQLLLDIPAGPPLSLEAQRVVDPFPGKAMAALAEAGLKPERFLAERSPHQFEIPVAPARGLASADHSVLLREVLREVARRQKIRVSFVPLLDPSEQGNGVHIHLSLRDATGGYPFYDPERPACLSEPGARFAAGILAHARALTALTAPSPVSFARLRPGRRSAGAACLGERNRETMLRIPPLLSFSPDHQHAAQMRLEYRGADAAANPYLALGALIHAGLWGIREELDPPEILDRDPAGLAPNEAKRFGVGALPASLEEALQALDENEVARGWLPSRLYELYVGVKRAEIEAAAGQELEETCRRYAAVY
jgi:glutamine synthetase